MPDINPNSMVVEVDDTAGRQASSSVDASGISGITQNNAPFTGSVEVGGGGGDSIPPARPEDYNQQKPKPEGEGGDDTQTAGDGSDTVDGGADNKDTGDDSPLKPTNALPEFKADDEAVVATYNETFKRADGTLNLNALSQQWWENHAANEGKDGSLSEGTYAYLETLGLTREDVKTQERALLALHQQEEGKVHEVFGGKSTWDRAIGWAANGGYSKAQVDNFNRDYSAGGVRREEAVALLHERFTSAGRQKPVPTNSANGGAGGGQQPKGGGDVFGSKQEWLDARKAAGDDNDKQAAISAKFHRSPGAARW
jgi:hypothetical protein